MRNIKLFEREINLIVNEDLRMAVKSYLEEATPDYFWTDGASASGKFHPKFSQGIGGLVRHTKAVVMFAEELLRMSSYAYMQEEYKDYVIAACLVHDTIKYGEEEFDKSEYKNHARNAADAFAFWCENNSPIGEPHFLLLNAIRSHMGQWSTEKEDRPFTSVDRCVHMADYIASRNFIDIPSIMDEYMEKACEWTAETGEMVF
jgi:HD superfamily phosphohydrolase YqeK